MLWIFQGRRYVHKARSLPPDSSCHRTILSATERPSEFWQPNRSRGQVHGPLCSFPYYSLSSDRLCWRDRCSPNPPGGTATTTVGSCLLIDPRGDIHMAKPRSLWCPILSLAGNRTSQAKPWHRSVDDSQHVQEAVKGLQNLQAPDGCSIIPDIVSTVLRSTGTYCCMHEVQQ